MSQIKIKSGLFKSVDSDRSKVQQYEDIVIVDKLDDRLLFIHDYKAYSFNIDKDNIIHYKNLITTTKDRFFQDISRTLGTGEFGYKRKFHSIYTLDYFSNRILDTPKFFKPAVRNHLKRVEPKFRRVLKIKHIKRDQSRTSVLYSLVNGRRKRCKLNIAKLSLEVNNREIALESEKVFAKVPIVY